MVYIREKTSPERNFQAIRRSQLVQVERLVSYPLVFIHLRRKTAVKHPISREPYLMSSDDDSESVRLICHVIISAKVVAGTLTDASKWPV